MDEQCKNCNHYDFYYGEWRCDILDLMSDPEGDCENWEENSKRKAIINKIGGMK